MELNKSYIGPRSDILDVVPSAVSRLLDVGCSIGSLGQEILNQHPKAQIYGIELNTNMANMAREKLYKVYSADMNEFSLTEEFPVGYFDCVILADILEHLIDPWRVVREAIEVSARHGTIIACVPNVRHMDTLFNLFVRGTWPYRDRGIHDRTHLRFFTRRNLIEMFSSPSVTIEKIVPNYRIIERPARINRWSRYLALPGLRCFLAFQYIIVARKL